ncbi:AAA family ATPase [Lentzea sp. CA-135723]|uniref:helix-turn-helix transcriptional regulator n=1 Tax=Lentzea sp. CA-135723 TaxID=3239950 RepID=UPI003D8F1E38
MLVERTRELATLLHVLEDCRQGRSAVAMITGARATGKTALLHAFGEEVQRSDALLLSASCTPGERSLPLGVFSQLQRNVPEEFRAARSAGDLTPLLDEDTRQGHLLRQASTALLAIAETRPVVIVVDDVQYVDELSKEALLHVLGRLRSTRVAVVFTQGVGAREPRSLFHTEFLRHPHRHSVWVSLLSPNGVAEVVAAELGQRTAAEFGARYHEMTGGNPLLLRALLEDQHRTPFDGAPVAGEGFAEAVMSCLHRGDPAIREVAHALAVLDTHSDHTRLLARVVEAGQKAVTKDVETLADMGLLQGTNYRDAAIREAVLEDASLHADLPDLHQRAACLLSQDGADRRVVAAHLVSSGTSCPEWALSLLREAADVAILEDQVEEAVEYLEFALHEQAGEAPIELVMMLVRLKERLAPASVLQHVPELGQAMREGRLLGHGLSWFVRLLVLHGRGDDVAEGLAKLVSRSGELDDHDRAEVAIARMWAAGAYPDLVADLPQISLEPVGVDVRTGMRVDAAAALAQVVDGRLDENLIMTAERVLQSANLAEEPSDEISSALHVLLYLEKLDSVKTWCDRLVARGRHSSPGWHGVPAMIRAEVAFRRGDLAVARDYAQEALDRADPRIWGASIGMALGTLILATTAMGRHDEAAAAMRQRVPQHAYRGRYGLHYLYARGHYHLATEQLHAALGDFLTCGELMVKWKIDSPGIVPWRAGAAEVYTRLGNLAKARELADQQLALPVLDRSLSRGMAMRVKAATTDLRQRSQLLYGALEEVQAAGAQLEVARVLADLSQMYHELGQPDRARITARRAWRLAKDCQAETLCAQLLPDNESRAEASPGEARAEARWGALSDAERRVAGLAALGHTNREIATKLYVTVSTVEQHLTKVYRKLNITQRRDLPADLWNVVAFSA